ncbi:MAG: UPF0149 family protein [Gammaproteobacteria bacterium]
MNVSFDPDDISAELEPLQRVRCHAALCGALVAGGGPHDSAKFASTLDKNLDAMSFQTWAQRVQAQLQATDFSFRLCMPDDGAALAARVGALAAWAREFLSALGQAGERLNSLDAEAQETLQELDAIGQGAAVGESDEESEELMYAELVEHVRLSVLFLYGTLNPPEPSMAQ